MPLRNEIPVVFLTVTRVLTRHGDARNIHDARMRRIETAVSTLVRNARSMGRHRRLIPGDVAGRAPRPAPDRVRRLHSACSGGIRLRRPVHELHDVTEALTRILGAARGRLRHLADWPSCMDLLRGNPAAGCPQPIHRRRDPVPASGVDDRSAGAESTRPTRRPKRPHWLR